MAAIFYNDIFLEHDTGPGHPECSGRITGATRYLQRVGMLNDVRPVERPIRDITNAIGAVHDINHINRVQVLAGSGGGMVDPDTVVSTRSYDAAVYAAGACMAAIDAIMAKSCKSAFCPVRPPGHHASASRSMGFCIFNNAAIAARYLQTRHNIERVLIVDWDVHHGNGTQDIFYDDPSVFYFSMHRFPFYPGTGNLDETGNGRGAGYTVNVPLGHDTAPNEYIKRFTDIMNGQAAGFGPQFVIISAGFDAHVNDPIGGLNLDVADFAELTSIAVRTAKEHCGGRLISTLEGGYNLEELPKCVEAHLGELP